MFNTAQDYRALVADLVASKPLDEAMSLAVGGDYETMGTAEADILADCGFGLGSSLVDIGCGSGRLSSALTVRFGGNISYLGTDVVPQLLTYARTRAAPSYSFALTDGIAIPASTRSADFVSAFSVFTHLSYAQTREYLREAARVLRPGGTLVCSVLELWPHRQILINSARMLVHGHLSQPNVFVLRTSLKRWARRAGFDACEFVSPSRCGQTVAVLRRT